MRQHIKSDKTHLFVETEIFSVNKFYLQITYI